MTGDILFMTHIANQKKTNLLKQLFTFQTKTLTSENQHTWQSEKFTVTTPHFRVE